MSFEHELRQTLLIRTFVDHIKTFHYFKEDKIIISRVLAYLGCPLAVAIFLMWVFPSFPRTIFAGLVDFFAIFCGFLFAFIALVKAEHKNYVERKDTVTAKLCNETYSSSVFCVLLSLSTIIAILFHGFLSSPISKNIRTNIEHWKYFHNLVASKVILLNFLDFIIIYFTIIFIITLMMVISRFYKICKPTWR